MKKIPHHPRHRITDRVALLAALHLASPAFCQGAWGEPELRATAHTLPGVVIKRPATRPLQSRTVQSRAVQLGADQNTFALGAGQSKFNLGTSADQARAHNGVNIRVDRQNPAIMTIVGGNEQDIQKLLAQRYHRAVVPCVQYTAPAGPMQQFIGQQQLNAQVMQQQTLTQQTLARQTIVAQPATTGSIGALPIETVNRFMQMFRPQNPNNPELTAEAKKLKPFGTPTIIRWDPWYNRIKAASDSRWNAYNNQLNAEATAHITVYNNATLAVTGVDVNLFKSARPFDGAFNEATKQAVLETIAALKNSPLLKFPASTRRTKVSFDLVFATDSGGTGKGGRGRVGMNAPINDVETIYGL